MREEKAALRRAVLAARDAEPGLGAKSATIADRLRALPEHARARVSAWYVGVGTEVATRELIAGMLERDGATVAVPVCGRDDLTLIVIRSLDELAPARFGLLEPPPELRALPDRILPPEDVDLFVVPGVAFDRAGGRVGYGKGYYDRLLARARPDAAFVALAFECQLVERVPVGPADVRVHRIVTEHAVLDMAPGRVEQG